MEAFAIPANIRFCVDKKTANFYFMQNETSDFCRARNL